MGGSLSIRISCVIHPTESEAKIRDALSNAFPAITFSREGISLAGSSATPADLNPLRKLFFDKKILDTVRSRLTANSTGLETSLLLHKQALAAGKAALVDSDEESPMGAVRITLGSPALHDFINWLAPATVEGRPVDERTIEELGIQDP